MRTEDTPALPPRQQKTEQRGATDQLEQLAATLAQKNGREAANDEDRQQAREQLGRTSPPAEAVKPEAAHNEPETD